MKDFYKVSGHENLFRDPNTGAVFTTQKPNRNHLRQHLDTTADDINSLKEEIRELKLLLLEHIKKHG